MCDKDVSIVPAYFVLYYNRLCRIGVHAPQETDGGSISMMDIRLYLAFVLLMAFWLLVMAGCFDFDLDRIGLKFNVLKTVICSICVFYAGKQWNSIYGKTLSVRFDKFIGKN